MTTDFDQLAKDELCNPLSLAMARYYIEQMEEETLTETVGTDEYEGALADSLIVRVVLHYNDELNDELTEGLGDLNEYVPGNATWIDYYRKGAIANFGITALEENPHI